MPINRDADMPVLTAVITSGVAKADPRAIELALLEREINRKDELIKSLFLKRFFEEEGAFPRNRLKSIFDEHSVSLDPDRPYVVLLVSPDVTGESSERVNHLLCLTTLAVKDVFDALSWPLELERVSGKSVAAVLEAEDMSGRSMDAALKRLEKNVRKSGFTVSAAYSGPENDYTRLPSVLTSVRKTLSYTFMLGPSSILCSERTAAGDADFTFVTAQVKNICAALMANRIEQAQGYYRELISLLVNAQIDFAKDALIHLTFSIHGAMAKSADRDMNELLGKMKDFHKKLTQMSSISGTNRLFENLFAEITECINNYIKTKNEALIIFAREFIQAHYSDINLSLCQVADNVHITTSYLGKLFKQSTHLTFSDYLKNVRLQKACELLRETDQTINTISGLCGFTNSSYFYNVFKKQYKITPNSYRSGGKNRG